MYRRQGLTARARQLVVLGPERGPEPEQTAAEAVAAADAADVVGAGHVEHAVGDAPVAGVADVAAAVAAADAAVVAEQELGQPERAP